MRVTYRTASNKNYWNGRWSVIPADAPMQNTSVYPLKYALQTVDDSSGRILEAGCGAGRILRYYHERGYPITGFDFIDVAVTKLREADPTLDVEVGDITDLKHADGSYRYVLAFGLYHNLEHNLEKAVQETCRVLEPGGKVCASFRADNIQTRLTDWLTERRTAPRADEERFFHKRNLTRKEFTRLFEQAGFIIESVHPVENMPILYKFRLFRSRQHKVFDENMARRDGYRLSWLGQTLQNFLMRFLPDQFCNIYVLIARKA